MRSTILPLLMLLSSIASAQSKVIQYYQNTNLAELAICDSNLAEANRYYKEAFAINPKKPFSKDLLNAFYSAMDTKEYALAEGYLAKLLSRSIGKKFIDSGLLGKYNGEQLQKLKAMLAKHPNRSLEKNALVAELNKMIKWDQDVRTHFSHIYDGAYMVDSTYYADHMNGKHLMQLFLKHGVPNEDVVGNGNLDLVPGADPAYSIIILHNGTGSEDWPAVHFDTMLYKAIQTFDFDARVFASVVYGANNITGGFYYGDVALNFPLMVNGVMFAKKIYANYWDEASEQTIDAERAKIGLEPLEDLRKKIAIKNKGRSHILGKYSFNVHITVMDADSEESLGTYLSRYGKENRNKSSLTTARKNISEHRHRKISYGETYYLVIGKTNLDSIISEKKDGYPEWKVKTIPYQNWKNRHAPLRWGEHAEIVRNAQANITTDTGRHNQAIFVPGYRIYAGGYAYTYSSYGSSFLNTECIFENGLLISFTADVDSGFYRYRSIIKEMGMPVVTRIQDTLQDGSNRILKTKKYTWQKGNNRTVQTVSEYYNYEGKKKISSVYQMIDMKKYTAYLQKVDAEETRLEAEYLASKK